MTRIKQVLWGLALALGGAVGAWAQTPPTLRLGAATVLLQPKGSDKPPPAAPWRTEAMLKQAAPSSQWYSTVAFNARPGPVFAQPLSFKTTPAGLEMALPRRQEAAELIPFAVRPEHVVAFPHEAALIFSPLAFEPEPARLARASDWAVDIAMARGADQLLATIAHGSPYAYFQLSRGDVRIRLAAPGERLAAVTDARQLGLRVNGTSYVIFGPGGVRWEQVSPTEWAGRLPEGKGFFSAAALPDDRPETLQLLARHAYAFVTDTAVAWNYDAAAGKVQTRFAATTRVLEGPDHGPLLGLYPHHWHENQTVAGKLGPVYDTVRGKLRLLAAPAFTTERPWQGFLPHWPGVTGGPGLVALEDEFKRDFRRRRDLLPSRENPDNWRVSVYWAGQGLTKLTQLAAVAEQQGRIGERDQLLALAKERMEFWFSGKGKASYFMLDRSLGTVVAYPDEFFSVEQMNDHHFHYGYWIRAAAEIALRDPQWAAKDQWGAMIELLISDIAHTQRGSAGFPYIRNYDAYEGHSWAVGIGGVDKYGNFGNNQESSSEAVNAWAGLILWGEVTGNRELRDLGIYLYANETNAIDHYWFDLYRLVFPPDYKPAETSMVFGGMFVHNTWWTDEPRQIHGINLLPVAGFSTYLGRDPAFIKRNLAAMDAESAAYRQRGKFPPNPPPEDIWQDIFAKVLALADPAAALAQYKPRGSVQDGNTASHTLHWIASLQALGTPDFGVTADTALYQVFKRAEGQRHYLAFNAGKVPITVRFSDGKQLIVAPGVLGRLP
ncbi:Glycoside hydrolase [Rubrivivax sp. A210]|uniref:glycosyl hydrolase n=1 Tax=Rubrivivax sp. A210 TaxID=2772301 RepID=UPI001919BAB3|nr:glycosyl hydrolase [Rubrivivax sp. A210]CAD5372778.1 Glycoside hydrolase [Rubrivivax sp. A210]